MSIFAGTLDKHIAAQLKAREKIVSQWGDTGGKDKNGNPIFDTGISSRDSRFLLYTAGKNSFVRLRSFVNYDSYKRDSNTNIKLSKDGKYEGDDLSRKYVLEGGTLFYDGASNTYELRRGVAQQEGIYASDLDRRGINSNEVDRLYGIRPMPGITSVEIASKSAYGSLREATVNFMAWDRHQLEELEVLFMRPGYSVFLDWGWSQYLDHDIPTSLNDYPDVVSIKQFDDKTLDVWSSLSEDDIYKRIDDDVKKYKGNYDALFGYIKNFSWQLMPNGGFQCSTTLISRGEAIDSIKATGNPNSIVIGSNIVKNFLPYEERKPILSLFEQIFLNIKGRASDLEFFSNTAYQTVEGTFGEFYIEDPTQRNNLIQEVDNNYASIANKLYNYEYLVDMRKSVVADQFAPNYIARSSDYATAFDAYLKNKGSDMSSRPNGSSKNFFANLDRNPDRSNTAVKAIEGHPEGNSIEYISMNTFIAILNRFFIPRRIGSANAAVDIVIPVNTPILASEDSVSIDPTTCMIVNSYAKFICDNTNGFKPELYEYFSMQVSPSRGSIYIVEKEFINDVKYVNQTKTVGNTYVAILGDIYISINKILDTYRNMANGNPNGVDALDLLQDILDQCSFALGGINTFKLQSERNIVRVIDIHYLENEKESSKFKLDPIGLKSICRDVKINSRIFAEQSTMIAIGATSGENTTNLGDIYASTQNYFNWGLQDRVLNTTFNDPVDADIKVNGVVYTGEQKYYFEIWNLVETLTGYIHKNVLGLAKTTNIGDTFYPSLVPQQEEIINAASLLKTLHYQINGEDVNFKALIPFELEVTLDGIGGLVIGQIFTIDKSILPKDYYNKKLGFIITGISHSLQNNDWTTNVRTQICLLENDDITGLFGVNKADLKKQIEEIKRQAAKNAYLPCALADFLLYFIHLGMVEKNKIEGTNENLIISSPTPFTPTMAANYITNLVKNVGGEGLVSYLVAWYNHVKDNDGKNDPNYPKNFDEFITTQDPITKNDVKFTPEVFLNAVTDSNNPLNIVNTQTNEESFYIGHKLLKNTFTNFFPYIESEVVVSNTGFGGAPGGGGGGSFSSGTSVYKVQHINPQTVAFEEKEYNGAKIDFEQQNLGYTSITTYDIAKSNAQAVLFSIIHREITDPSRANLYGLNQYSRTTQLNAQLYNIFKVK